MRFSTLLIILVILGACNFSSSQTSPVVSPSVEIEEIPQVTPSLRFAQATVTSAPDLVNEEKEEDQEAISRAYEDGLPLAARVNDQPIFLETYQEQVTQFEQALKGQGVDITSENGQAVLAQNQKQVLDGLVEQLIIEQQAKSLGVIVTREDVEAKAQENIAQLQDQAQFEKWLANNGLTYQEFLTNLESQLIANEVFENITQNVPETADQIQLRYIRVEEEVTAQTIIEALKTGATFDTLAQNFSLDEDSENFLDWFPKSVGLVSGEVENIAFSLQPGEVSGPIPTPLGYYIIKLENKETNRPIAPEMLQLFKNKIFDDWLLEQRSSAVIEIYIAL